MSRVFFKRDVMRFTDPNKPTAKKQAQANSRPIKISEQPIDPNKPIKPMNWTSQLSIGCGQLGKKARRSILELPEMEDLSSDEDKPTKDVKPDGKPTAANITGSSILSKMQPMNTLPAQPVSKVDAPNKASPSKSNEVKPTDEQPTSASKAESSPQKKQPAATTGKKPYREKKIKKHKNEPNIVRQDLKRRYNDKFRGNLLKNQRMYMRNGQLKFKYRKKASEISQLELMASQSYDIYLHSISKALYLTLNLDSDDDEDKSQHQEEETIDLNARSKVDLEKLIAKIWGFKEFRFGQYETIMNVLNHRSTMFVSETGSGKSLSYILSAILQEGLAIVISPLISLMLDQIESIPEILPAACITSLLNREQKNRIINMVKQGKIKLLYMTPQALQTDLVFHLKDFPPVNFVCVDEAHCVSELSHNFRTTYLIVNELINNHFKFKAEKTILCLTATANLQTIESVMTKMEIKELIKSNSLRPKNLCVTISRDSQDVYRSLVEYLNTDQVRKLQGILIYCRTRRLLSQTFNYLTNSGFKAATFHAGLEQKEKTQLLQDFRTCKVRVVVATIALGMGLDFENLDCVIHINMPKSVESYVQEIGRAGRRGKRAYCHMFLHKNDYFTERNYIVAEGTEYEALKLFLNKIKEYTNQCARLAVRQSNQREQEESEEDNDKQKKQNSKPKPPPEPRESSNLKRNPMQAIKPAEEDEEDLEELCMMLKQHKKETLRELQKDGVICYARTQKLTQELDLRSESVITVLLKMEGLSEKKFIKVLPPNHQLLKISFYNNNHNKIREGSQFYKELTKNSRNYKGSIHVRLIDRCNELRIDPIDAISQLQKLSHTYFLKLEYEHEVILWRYVAKMTFEQFERDLSQELLHKIMEVEKNALTKLKIMYTLGFLNSFSNVQSMVRRTPDSKAVIPENSKTSISDLFDKYFSTETDRFYDQICDGEYYLPTWSLDEKDRIDIESAVDMFLQHQLDACPQQRPINVLKKFSSGRIVARVLLGVNTEAYNWQTYGQHPYWQRFKDKQYEQVLEWARHCVTSFLARYD